jgi:predicted GIY-YIG superfamily endonuclease
MTKHIETRVGHYNTGRIADDEFYYVYILKINNEFYIGYTEDLQRRVKQHKSEGKTELIYYEAYLDKEDANETASYTPV